ncbi:MAG: HAMP domain-containing sensor histidine kinase [Chitinophagaceae bacterium]|jgi:signal transduction histidine kinase/tetratricopeptide (TPR) repeat protein
MKSIFTLLLLSLFLNAHAEDKKPIAPDNKAFAGKPIKEKLMAWVSYCDLFLGNQEGYAEDYEGLKVAARQGLAITPANEYWFLSTFNYFLGACNKDRDSARKHYEKAIYYGQKGNETKKIITATSAILSEYGDDIKASEPYRNILINILDTIENDKLKCEIYYGLSFYYENIGWYETALDYELKMLKLRKLQLDTVRKEEGSSLKTNYGVSLNHIANLYINLQQTNKALEYYRESLFYFEDYRAAVEDSWKGMITSFSSQGMSDSVSYYYNKLYRSAVDSSSNPMIMAAANMAIADAALNHNQLDSADKYLTSALQYVNELKIEEIQLQWWMLKGKAEIAKGTSATVIAELKRWHDIAAKGDIVVFSELNYLLAQASTQNGNYKEATAYFTVYTRLADSITNQKISANIAEKEAHYQNEKKQEQITLKNKQLVEVQKQKTILTVSLALLIIVIILLINIYRNKKRTAGILDEKNKTLSLLNEQLNEANRTKARLFSIISHDLRSPISQVYQFLKLQQMRPELLNDEQKKKLTEKIQAATGSLLETMEDLLLWSKTQVSNIKPEREQIVISKLVTECLDLLALNLESKKLQVDYQFSGNLNLNSDPNFLLTIIRNLLQNAIKAAPEESLLNIEIEREEECIRLRLSNEGKTFTQQDFVRIISESGEDASLSGLGLKLVWELSQKLNCRIEFSTEAANTVVKLYIPVN